MVHFSGRLHFSAHQPVIILVEPQLGENIGMVARAMCNFGLAKLRLVNPRDGWPNEKARATAAKADHIIDETRVWESLAEAVADLHFVYATTARSRNNFKSVCSPMSAASVLRMKLTAGQAVGLVFGRERWGLTNKELTLFDEIITFPVDPAFSSLNISQAVLLMVWEWMKSGLERGSEKSFDSDDSKPATKNELFGLLAHRRGLGSTGLLPSLREKGKNDR